MVAIDSSVLIELLTGEGDADTAELALREALTRGPVVVFAGGEAHASMPGSSRTPCLYGLFDDREARSR